MSAPVTQVHSVAANMVHSGFTDYFQVLKAIAGGDTSKAIGKLLEFKYGWTERLLHPFAISPNNDQVVVSLVRGALETSRAAAVKI
ncbi:hypothetical protein BGW39_003367 [Mortierella sp. 14UC]|nr:hypothetical protein BGW39_003367 [Mortierella sp. 14UC]